MKKWSGRIPRTGERMVQSKGKPFVPNAKDTSADTEEAIKAPPTPFKNNMTTPQMPTAGAPPGGAVPGLEPRVKAGMSGKTVGAKALPNLSAVGQNRPINQSGQVNGRMGTSFPKKVRPNGAGFPSRRNASFYGE